MKMSHAIALVAAFVVFGAIFFYSAQLGHNEDVATYVMMALAEHPEIDESLFEISESAGVVTIRGTVQSESMRRLVIEQIKKVNGVVQVVDEIVVSPPPEPVKK